MPRIVIVLFNPRGETVNARARDTTTVPRIGPEKGFIEATGGSPSEQRAMTAPSLTALEASLAPAKAAAGGQSHAITARKTHGAAVITRKKLVPVFAARDSASGSWAAVAVRAAAARANKKTDI